MNPFPTRTLQAGAMLGFLTTAAIGWKLADRPERPTEDQPGISNRSAGHSSRPVRPNRRGGPSDSVRQRMAAIRAISSPGDRLRATMALAESLPASEIAAWLDGRWFPTGEGFDMILFNKLLKERWQQEDPEGLLAWGLKSSPGLVGETLKSWANTDPQRALGFFRNHPNAELEAQVLTEIAKRNPSLALQALAESPASGGFRSGMGDYYLRQLFQQLAKASPAALESAMESLPPALRKRAETELIGCRLAASFGTEIRKLWERPDGWRIFDDLADYGTDFRKQLFGELGNLPPSWRARLIEDSYRLIDSGNAEKWIHADLEGFGFTDSQAQSLRSRAVGSLASKDPEAALRMMNDLDFDSKHRNSIINNLFLNLRGNTNTEALLALLNSDEERKLALSEMPRIVKAMPRIEQPADWLAQVAGMDPQAGYSATYQYLSMLRSWDAEKLTSLGDGFRSLDDGQKRQVANLIANNGSHLDNIRPLQAEALRYLIANPESGTNDSGPDPGRIQHLPDGTPISPAEPPASHDANIVKASQFAVDWGKQDPNAAGEWVRSLPAGDARLWAQKNLAANWAQVDPEAADQWLNTLPTAERAQVREFMAPPKDKRE
ncbi:MAG: hypothetical protein J0M04_23230 [Verrucomicrobia bacterium]|nr:hypothetical protein [Verrucomicrobiota bacterium]